MSYPPLHPLRLEHPLEKALREEWQDFLESRPNVDILAGPHCNFNNIPEGIEYDTIDANHYPYPYGRTTDRDKMVMAETIQWLGTGIGLTFLMRAFQKAGGKVEFDDYKRKKIEVEFKA